MFTARLFRICRHHHLDGQQSAHAVLAAAAQANDRIAAYFCESALSCAGQVMLPDGYLQSVYDVMKSDGIICIADEVQCGLCRTGSSFWCFAQQVCALLVLTLLAASWPLRKFVFGHQHVEEGSCSLVRSSVLCHKETRGVGRGS
jgi:Aminotransferase class-III